MFYDITHQCIIPHVAIHVFLDDPRRTVSITFCFDVFLAGLAPRDYFFLFIIHHRGSNGEVINCVTVPADLPFLSDISDIQS
jgi:hypothetical protein